MSDLPPLDQAQSYVVVGPDDQRGPYTLELLVSEVVAGRLDDNTPVWWPGLADWTTMAGHPAVAAEIARRRGAPQPSATAFAPPAAPPPPQDFAPAPAPAEPVPAPAAEADPAAQAAPAAQQATAAQPEAAPQQAQAEAVEEVLRAGGVEPAPSAPEAPEEPAQDPAGRPEAGAEAVFGVGSTGPGADREPIDVPAVEVTREDFEAVDAEAATEGDGFRAAGAGEGLDPFHGEAFADLIRRSRARADAASMVENANDAVVSAFDSAASDQGFTRTAIDDSGDRSEMTYIGSPGETLSIRVDHVTGHLLAAGDGHLDLEASCSSERFNGTLQAGTGEHGEVVVASRGTGSGAAASVALHLPLEDYVGEDHSVDEAALGRDAAAVVATLADRVRG